MAKQTHDLVSSLRISTTEMHTCGDPVRIVESGCPEIKGNSFLEKLCFVKDNLQYVRTFLTHEPRGHRDMVGFILVEPDKESGAAVGVIYFDSSVFLDMCGHMTIALGRYAVDKGLVGAMSPVTSFKIQAPCGVVTLNVDVSSEGKSTGTSGFISVPAFVWKTGVEVNVPSLGTVTVDISFGGGFYAILTASQVGLDVRKDSLETLSKSAQSISDAVRAKITLQHPILAKVTYLQGTILTDGNEQYSEDSTRHIVVLGEYAQVARSTCGSGTTARVALQYFNKHIKLNETRVFENAITKSRFNATPRRETTCGEFAAIEVEIQGKANYTGSATFTCEEGDVMGSGFLPGV